MLSLDEITLFLSNSYSSNLYTILVIFKCRLHNVNNWSFFCFLLIVYLLCLTHNRPLINIFRGMHVHSRPSIYITYLNHMCSKCSPGHAVYPFSSPPPPVICCVSTPLPASFSHPYFLQHHQTQEQNLPSRHLFEELLIPCKKKVR